MNPDPGYHDKVAKADPLFPEAEPIQRASRILHAGGLVIFPTAALYGIGVDAFNEKALERIFRIKGRKKEKPLLILVESIESMDGLVEEIPDTARQLMEAFWPGRLTLIFRAKSCLPNLLTAGTGKIGIRLPLHPVARSLVRQMGSPITGTSANLSEKPPASKIENLPKKLFKEADLILDSGPLQGGVGSTVLDVTCTPHKLVREGSLSFAEISKIFR